MRLERAATHQGSSVEDVLSRVPLLASALAISLACVALLGWGVGLSSLVRLLPGWPLMMPRTAVSVILIGLALCLLRLHRTGSLLRLSQGFILAAAAIALVNLGEYILGWNSGTDWVVGLEARDFFGRMAAPTAVAIVLTAAAVLLLDVRTRQGRRPTHYLASRLMILLEVIGQGYGAPAHLFGHPGMAFNTAVSCGSSIGVICARRNLGLRL
jgi:hypothetical protein